MAVIASTLAAVDQSFDKAVTVTWSSLANGDSGTPVSLAAYSDRSIQVSGTFGAGGNVNIEGSLDGTNYFTLTDPQGNALSVTAGKIEAISELVAFIRPDVTAGDGTTALTVTLLARK